MHTIVEAGTGVGKSLAYLVPAVRSGKKVVLSTGTIALQEQLVYKDIPLVEAALGVPMRVTLLKGRSHYLCRQKFERMRADRLLAPSRVDAAASGTGQRAREPAIAPSFRFCRPPTNGNSSMPTPTSASASSAPHFRDCFYFNKRDEAKYADIIVVNHALFFLDLAGGGGLLPPYDVAVLDEAHQCERWATDARHRGALRKQRSDGCCASCAAPTSCPSAFEGRVRSRRRPLGGVARARSRRSLSARRQRRGTGAAGSLRRRCTTSRTGSSPTGRMRESTKAAAIRAKPSAGAILMLRTVVAHEAVIDRIEAGVRRNDRVGRTQRRRRALRRTLRAARSRRFSARHALRAHAERRPHERDALDERVVRVRAAPTRNRRRAGARRAFTVRLRAPSAALHRAGRVQPEVAGVRAPRRAAGRGMPGSQPRPRLRALYFVRAAARSLRAAARASRVSGSPARASCRVRTCSIGSAARPTPCSSAPARFGKASTSSATRFRA